MSLKIIRAEDPIEVNQLVVVIYGSPGLGKTTTGFTAAKPLLIDFDKGAYRAAIRGDSVSVSSWADVANITDEDLAPYETVVVDTVGRALDFLTTDIIKKNPKHGYGGALTLQGYGQLKAKFTAWLTMLKQLNKDVVLIAHSTEDKNNDAVIERLDVQGGSRSEIYKSADAMARLYIKNGQRILNFSPTDAAFGKNPGCLEPLKVPGINETSIFLEKIIADIKEHLNELTEEQAKRQKEIEEWSKYIKSAKTVDEHNTLVAEITGEKSAIVPLIKGMIHKQATQKGFVFDKKTKGYKTKEERAEL